VGNLLGLAVGPAAVGLPVVGPVEGVDVGDLLGFTVGFDVVGDLLGLSDGLPVVGPLEGVDVGDLLGFTVGFDVVGDLLGLSDGLPVVGPSVGIDVGVDVAFPDLLNMPDLPPFDLLSAWSVSYFIPFMNIYSTPLSSSANDIDRFSSAVSNGPIPMPSVIDIDPSSTTGNDIFMERLWAL
jgi:hypothetical protein